MAGRAPPAAGSSESPLEYVVFQGRSFLIVTCLPLFLSACVEETAATPDMAPSPAEQACLAAVSNAANNGDVTVLGSEFSQAGTSVRIGVGPQRAPWSCIAYSDGTTAGVMSMADEGGL